VLRYCVRRVLLAVPVLVGVATLVFSLIHLVPGDPAQAMLGDGAAPQDIAELRTSLGLDQPLLTQYLAFLRHAVTGDLGKSFRTGQPVTTMIIERIPATAELAFAAMVVAIVIALPLGVVAAVWRGTAIDYSAMTFALAACRFRISGSGRSSRLSLPVELGWLPVSGRGTLAHLVLPAFSLGLALAAIPGANDEGEPARRARRALRAGGARPRRVKCRLDHVACASQQHDSAC
jgi:ABC-type dipeptide/oligopeptide/nickel transport system permease component